jgi:hypothetical protein
LVLYLKELFMTNSVLSMVMACAVLSVSAGGCALSDESAREGQAASDLTATSGNSFVLFLSTETAPQDKVIVTSTDGTPPRDCFGGCQFAYLAGSQLTLRIPFPTDKPNCIMFGGWSGACVGQGSTCSIPLNGDTSTSVNWVNIRGCVPR